MPDLIRHPPSSSPRGRAGRPRIKSGVTRKEERPRQKWRGLFWFTRRPGGRGGTPIRGSHRGSFGPSITGSSLSEVGVPAGAFSGKTGRKPEAPAALGPSRTSASRVSPRGEEADCQTRRLANQGRYYCSCQRSTSAVRSKSPGLGRSTSGYRSGRIRTRSEPPRQAPRASRVRAPAMPSAVRPLEAWKAITACLVAGPKSPSAVRPSFSCSHSTSSP